NDGLNTLVPYANKRYYELRPVLGITEDKVLKINNDLGFHPGMKGISELYNEKKVAVIQNVGYPNANRSHFKSMDIWHSASPEQTMKYKPLALTAKNASIPCFASLVDIQSMVGDPDAEAMLRKIQGMDAMEGSATRVVQQANKSALDAMSALNKQLAGYAPKQTYGNDAFGNGFKQIAQLVATSPATRVVYLSAGGFDTHARQAESQERLLTGLSNAVTAFQREMEAIGKADKVMVLVFSEFGRRSYENASGGTDHGAAGPMLLIGKNVKGGLYGKLPNLSDLQDGDLKFDIDFRQVYATALDNWIGGDSGVVLGKQFDKIAAV
ncbi:MAG: DUF1501 domain-containing protein, partial [Fimbriimonadaceae bacterium]